MMTDPRKNPDALAGLFDTDMLMSDEFSRKKRKAVADPDATTGLLQMPKTPMQRLVEEDGALKTTGKMMLNVLTGGLLSPLIHPELMGKKDQYENDMELYKKAREMDLLAQQNQMQTQKERSRHQSGLDILMNGVDDPEDAYQRLALAKEFGIDNLQYALGGGVVEEEPDYEKVEINGDYYYTDKNNPTAAPIPVGMADGTIASKALDADTRKTSGWFKRAVPALENMHKLEDEGVMLPREALLLTQQAQDADGFFDVFAYNKLLNDLGLSKKQKQYLRNAQDLAMIQLRKESGAAIGVQEMFNELNQNVMLTDMSDEGYAYQRSSRANKYRGLADGLAEPVVRDFKSQGLFERMDKLRSSSERVLIEKAEEGDQEAADELLRRLVEDHRSSQVPEQPLIYRSSGNQ